MLLDFRDALFQFADLILEPICHIVVPGSLRFETVALQIDDRRPPKIEDWMSGWRCQCCHPLMRDVRARRFTSHISRPIGSGYGREIHRVSRASNKAIRSIRTGNGGIWLFTAYYR